MATVTVDKWFEVFAAGDYGKKGRYTERDLDQVVSKFDPTTLAVPLVIGHPKPGSPSYGWVDGLRRVGRKLEAHVTEVVKPFADAVNDKVWNRVSVRLQKAADGGYRLAHIGFLGAHPPAVEGLGAVSFADEGGESVDFTAEERAMEFTQEQLDQAVAAAVARAMADARAAAEQDFAAERSRLEQEIATHRDAQRRADAKATLGRLTAEGRLSPAMATGLEDFMLALDETETHDFAADGGAEPQKATLRTFFDGFLGRLPKADQFKPPVAGKDTDPAKGEPNTDFAAPPGAEVDVNSRELAARARAYQKTHNTTFTAALAAVEGSQK